MTIREWAEGYCRERGMFPDQAKAVIDALAADEIGKPMLGRWDDRVDGYPPPMMAVLAISIDDRAVRWIDANCPKAWFRPVFAGGG